LTAAVEVLLVAEPKAGGGAEEVVASPKVRGAEEEVVEGKE